MRPKQSQTNTTVIKNNQINTLYGNETISYYKLDKELAFFAKGKR
jgi:hypothetical protein